MSREAELRLRRIAARQHSLVTRRQAREVGFSSQSIRTKLDSGLWVPARRGVYDVGGSPASWERRVLLEVLSAGTDAFASHLSAACIQRISPLRPDVIDVTIPHRRHPEPVRGRRIHRTRVLPRSDVTEICGIPVTRVPRTPVDTAGVVVEHKLEQILDTALVTGRTSIDAMRRYVRNHPNRPHIDVLKALLSDREHGVPESELERVFERLMKRTRMPIPVRQRPIRRFRVDYAYVDLNIIIEVDGSATRSTKRDLQRDRRRQNEIALEELLILRFTWDDVTTDEQYVIETVRRALRTRGGI